MNKISRKLISALLAVTVMLTSGMTAQAAEEKPYLAMGADLSEAEKNTVLGKLGVKPEELAGYDTVTITNADEKAYLSGYLSESVIGSRALSSVLVQKKASGGIYVTTHNISYCTTGMYRNALITAGISDAEVIVAGPFNISGTAALVGALKAYENMTGNPVPKENIDAAVNELVTTGSLAEALGDSEKVEQMIALAKQYVVEGNLESEEDILNAVDKASKELDIKLTDEQMGQIKSLMAKISDLDIDKEALKSQAKELYGKLKEMGIDFDDPGFRSKVKAIFMEIIEFVKSLFR